MASLAGESGQRPQPKPKLNCTVSIANEVKESETKPAQTSNIFVANLIREERSNDRQIAFRSSAQARRARVHPKLVSTTVAPMQGMQREPLKEGIGTAGLCSPIGAVVVAERVATTSRPHQSQRCGGHMVGLRPFLDPSPCETQGWDVRARHRWDRREAEKAGSRRNRTLGFFPRRRKRCIF